MKPDNFVLSSCHCSDQNHHPRLWHYDRLYACAELVITFGTIYDAVRCKFEYKCHWKRILNGAIFSYTVFLWHHKSLFMTSTPVNSLKHCVPHSILCLTSRTTVTSACIPEEDACHRARNLCVISRVKKGTPGLTHKGCVLQHVSLGALSDVTVFLGMRQR